MGIAAGESGLIDIGDVDHRLRGQQMQLAQITPLIVAQGRGPHRYALIKQRAHALEQLTLQHSLLVAALGRLGRAIYGFVRRRQIGERELGIDDLEIRQRIDATGHMDDVIILEATHHVGDRVDFADMGEELIAQALALRCAFHQARNVDELHRGRHNLLRVSDLRKLLEPHIRHRHHADVRIDGAERIVLGRDLGAGQCVEQRRLTDIRQTDDPALDGH
jgi:hypothetical protein